METLKDDYISFEQCGSHNEVILRKSDISFIEVFENFIAVNTYNGVFSVDCSAADFLRRLGWIDVITARDWMKKHHPETCSDSQDAGVKGCPSDYDDLPLRDHCAGLSCDECWSRPMPEVEK